jgi:hypothetical protein
MNCKCYGNNHNNQMIGATMSGCGFFCKLGRGLKKAANFVNDLGLLPPGINVLVNAGANLMGANNADDTTSSYNPGDYSARQLNQRINNNRIGRVPNVF